MIDFSSCSSSDVIWKGVPCRCLLLFQHSHFLPQFCSLAAEWDGRFWSLETQQMGSYSMVFLVIFGSRENSKVKPMSMKSPTASNFNTFHFSSNFPAKDIHLDYLRFQFELLLSSMRCKRKIIINMTTYDHTFFVSKKSSQLPTFKVSDLFHQGVRIVFFHLGERKRTCWAELWTWCGTPALDF